MLHVDSDNTLASPVSQHMVLYNLIVSKLCVVTTARVSFQLILCHLLFYMFAITKGCGKTICLACSTWSYFIGYKAEI